MYFSGLNLIDDCVLGHGGTAHEVVDGFPVDRETTGAVGH